MISGVVFSEVMLHTVREISLIGQQKEFKNDKKMWGSKKHAKILSVYYVRNQRWTMRGNTPIFLSFGKYKQLDQPTNKQQFWNPTDKTIEDNGNGNYSGINTIKSLQREQRGLFPWRRIYEGEKSTN